MSDLDTLKSLGFSDEEIDNLTPQEFAQLKPQLAKAGKPSHKMKSPDELDRIRKAAQAKADFGEEKANQNQVENDSGWLTGNNVFADTLAHVGQNLLAGGGDELYAGTAAVADQLMNGDDSRSYNDHRAEIQGALNTSAERSPLATQIVAPGLMLAAGGLGGGAQAATGAARQGAQQVGQLMAKGAATGTILGGGSAYASADDGHRLEAVPQGALLGGLLGAAGAGAPLAANSLRDVPVLGANINPLAGRNLGKVASTVLKYNPKTALVSSILESLKPQIEAPPQVVDSVTIHDNPVGDFTPPPTPTNPPQARTGLRSGDRPSLELPDSPGPFEVETLGGTPVEQPQAPPDTASLPPALAADWLASPHEPQQGGASFKPAVSAARLRPEPTPRYQRPAPRTASPQTPIAVPESSGPLELEGGAPTPQPFDPGVAQDTRVQPPAKAQLELPPNPGPMSLEGESLAQGPSADLGAFENQPSGLETGRESLGRVAKPFRPATVAKRVEPPTQGQAFDPGVSATDPLPAPPKPSLELPAAPSEMQIERHNPNPRLSRDKQSFRTNPEATPSDLRDPVSGAVQKPKAEAPKPKPAVKAEAAREAAKEPAADFETHLQGARKKAVGKMKETMSEGMKDAPEYNDAKGAEILKHIKDGKTREEIKAATGLGVKALGKYFSRLFHSGKISLAERKAVQPGWESEP